ncbi:putative nuclease HARBI1 [Portunus trituberculatus]|uniref:putative nuclease HARBI1 n=1 Tax=Portunus trituberculatus TaxID=210409 RepID=UPI001E1D139E|nr:putative nuclease HARBI1 [Portunus trituberculatus]
MAALDEIIDEEMFEMEELRRVKIPCIVPKDRNDPFYYLSGEEFLERFRLPKDAVRDLIEEVRPRTHVDRLGTGCGIPLHLKMLVTLRYLATGSFLLTVADIMDIAKSSACRAVGEVVQLIAFLAPDYIKFPQPEARQMASKLYDIAGMPGVLGCIDCTHIPIQSLGGNNVEMYRCRKGFYSLNVQGICDSELKFMHVVASWPGSVHDSRIFSNCRICYLLDQEDYRGLYLLGDSGYPSREYLLTPLLAPRTEKHRRYNVAHIQTRNSIERAFGVLKRRFASLSIPLRTKLPNTKRIVMACAILHNIAISRRVDMLDVEIEPQEVVDLLEDEDDHELDATQVRESLIQRWF